MYAVNLNKDNGFVVLSASFLERPILAYSEKGNFDFETIGDCNGVVDWAYTTYLTINQRIENKEEPDDQVAEQWQAFGYQPDYIFPTEGDGGGGGSSPYPINSWYETTVKGPLLTTEWDQKFGNYNIGYNNFVRFNNCPDGTAPAGCVAVAMGQIMKYHNHPNIYNINTMPNSINLDNQTSNEAINIAYLLQDIGAKVNMNYSCYSSGAYSENARNAFVNNYGYDASPLVNTSYSLIRQNIDNYQPVYLRGYKNKKVKTIRIRLGIFRWTIKLQTTYSEGHAWVADGYKEIKKITKYSNNTTKQTKIADLVRCNWGWAHLFPYNHNGWFYYGNWVNYDQTYNEISDPTQTYFIYKQHMIHNIKPKNN